MKAENIFLSLWKDYVQLTPSAEKIHSILEGRGEEVLNDHIAFRTVNHPKVGLNVLAQRFLDEGYVEKDEYHITEKNLYAKHYEKENDPSAPKVFISEFLIENAPQAVQDIILEVVDQIPTGLIDMGALIFSGRTWGTISYETYQELRSHSEYLAWLYVFGFRANHFTINVNALTSVTNLEDMNSLLKENDFTLNVSGGEIKGGKQVFLEQSSILADMKQIQFVEGKFSIPSCYYEFALRHEKADGELFAGFVGDSANKIFESTDNKQLS